MTRSLQPGTSAVPTYAPDVVFGLDPDEVGLVVGRVARGAAAVAGEAAVGHVVGLWTSGAGGRQTAGEAAAHDTYGCVERDKSWGVFARMRRGWVLRRHAIQHAHVMSAPQARQLASATKPVAHVTHVGRERVKHGEALGHVAGRRLTRVVLWEMRGGGGNSEPIP